MMPLTVAGDKFVTLKLAGEVIEIAGAGLYVSVRGEVAVFPATSVATTETELEPGTKLTAQVKAPPDRTAAVPLQVTDPTPETASV